MFKFTLAASAAAALLFPLPVAAEEPMMKLADMLRCAAVYQVTSERAPKDSEAQLTAGRHFLQYYMIMLALAENKPDDKFDATTLKTLFEAENAIANSDAVLARSRARPMSSPPTSPPAQASANASPSCSRAPIGRSILWPRRRRRWKRPIRPAIPRGTERIATPLGRPARTTRSGNIGGYNCDECR